MGNGEVPLQPIGPTTYTRLHTTDAEAEAETETETEGETNNTTISNGIAEKLSEVRKDWSEFRQRLETEVDNLNWDVYGPLLIAALIVFAIGVCWYTEYQKEKEREFRHGFEVQKMSITDFNVTKSELKAQCQVIFNVTNRGPSPFFYEKGVVSIFYGDELLWATTTPDFFQSSSTHTMVIANINKTTIVPDIYIPGALISNRKLHKPGLFVVKYEAMVRTNVDTFIQGKYQIEVLCGYVRMVFQDPTTLTGGPAGCMIDVNWYVW